MSPSMSRGSLPHVLRVLVQPRDGVAPVAALIDAAQSTVVVKMFTLTSPVLLDALAGAQARGVRVRVMLNPARSSGSRANDEAEQRLRAAGVAVAWSNPRFAVTHEKSMVVDGRTALIATFNFGDKYFHATRDYGLLVEDPDAVREILSGFEADWRRQEFDPPPGSALLWSSRNAREGMAALIDSAQHSLAVQHPKFSDTAILDRLLAAQDRGVHLARAVRRAAWHQPARHARHVRRAADPAACRGTGAQAARPAPPCQAVGCRRQDRLGRLHEHRPQRI